MHTCNKLLCNKILYMYKMHMYTRVHQLYVFQFLLHMYIILNILPDLACILGNSLREGMLHEQVLSASTLTETCVNSIYRQDIKQTNIPPLPSGDDSTHGHLSHTIT